MSRMIKIVLGILGAIGLLIGGLFLFANYDAYQGEQAADVTNELIPSLEGNLYGYFAEPLVVGDYPAVLMVHEWWGMNQEIVAMAEILSEQGYVVLAIDTYRGYTATTVPGALLLRLSVPQDRVAQDMQVAYEWLASRPNVDENRIGVIGFCYGGGVALRHAIANPNIKAVVNLYGDTVDDPAAFGVMLTSRTPLLGIFGREDQQIPVSEVEAFGAALGQTEIPHSIRIFDGVGHAFVNPHTLIEGGAATQAWDEILRFFALHLQRPPVVAMN
ncbi:MAG: dienelactone hydrolase family protein [Anaerolineae bacterium]|nr:dienelactone hydrolase family protein [Anaerolineae bacterium]